MKTFQTIPCLKSRSPTQCDSIYSSLSLRLQLNLDLRLSLPLHWPLCTESLMCSAVAQRELKSWTASAVFADGHFHSCQLTSLPWEPSKINFEQNWRGKSKKARKPGNLVLKHSLVWYRSKQDKFWGKLKCKSKGGKLWSTASYVTDTFCFI